MFVDPHALLADLDHLSFLAGRIHGADEADTRDLAAAVAVVDAWRAWCVEVLGRIAVAERRREAEDREWEAQQAAMQAEWEQGQPERERQKALRAQPRLQRANLARRYPCPKCGAAVGHNCTSRTGQSMGALSCHRERSALVGRDN